MPQRAMSYCDPLKVIALPILLRMFHRVLFDRTISRVRKYRRQLRLGCGPVVLRSCFVGRPMASNDLELVFSVADLDGDGKISKDELIQFVQLTDRWEIIAQRIAAGAHREVSDLGLPGSPWPRRGHTEAKP